MDRGRIWSYEVSLLKSARRVISVSTVDHTVMQMLIVALGRTNTFLVIESTGNAILCDVPRESALRGCFQRKFQLVGKEKTMPRSPGCQTTNPYGAGRGCS